MTVKLCLRLRISRCIYLKLIVYNVMSVLTIYIYKVDSGIHNEEALHTQYKEVDSGIRDKEVLLAYKIRGRSCTKYIMSSNFWLYKTHDQ